ncbi:hypothetical protein CTA1_415 [Colletotrichum tanaceti]|uniref:Uncharacterized protein n=1 Tax=Colletotrichum tanaceti TaxID=1306861 RepID=A0A4U6XPS3_9PEZI|nr:hypothetical protein CTA1_415 [Colletotrichum tanaceti]
MLCRFLIAPLAAPSSPRDWEAAASITLLRPTEANLRDLSYCWAKNNRRILWPCLK